MINKVSIIIPVYNEQNTIDSILRRIHELTLINGIEKEIIVVNDASTDNTEEVYTSTIKTLESTHIIYSKHEKKTRVRVLQYIQELHWRQVIIWLFRMQILNMTLLK